MWHLVTFTKEIFNRKLHFLFRVRQLMFKRMSLSVMTQKRLALVLAK